MSYWTRRWSTIGYMDHMSPMLVLVLISALALCGCTYLPQSKTNTGGSEQSVLRDWLAADPPTFDVQQDSTMEVYGLARCLFSTLVRYRGSSLDLEPELLAAMPEVSPDGLVYRFRLREGILFADGVTHLTADDVRYTIERMLDPQERGANTWLFLPIRGARAFAEGQASTIEGIHVIDELHFELALEAPLAPFLAYLAVPSAAIYSARLTPLQGDNWGRWPIGTGPFRLAQHWPEERIILERNPYYFERPSESKAEPESGSKPEARLGSNPGNLQRVTNIDYRIIPDATTALLEFEAGTLDITRVPIADFDRLAALGRYPMLETNALNTYFLLFNVRNPQFRDPRVRRAMALAVDRRRLVDGLLSGHAEPARSFVPPGIPGAYPSGQGPAPTFDPEKARQLLVEANAVGRRLEVWQAGGDQVSTVNVALQEMFRDVGLDYRVVIRDTASFFADRYAGRIPGHQGNWWADVVDPDSFLSPFFSSRNSQQYSTNYRNADVDSLLEQARGFITPERRSQLYREIEKVIIAQDVAVIPLFHLRQNRAVQPTVGNLVLSPTNLVDYHNAYKTR